MGVEFKGSKSHTVGIELEIQLVGEDKYALVGTSSEIIDSLDGLGNSVKHELLKSCLEINTSVCETIGEAERDLYEKTAAAIGAAAKHDTRLCFGGTHPFSRWREQSLTDDPRYKRLLKMLQIVARRFNIFGLHVHVGVKEAEGCIYVLNRLLSYLPHLLALSVNSPFWQGEDTGLKSYRTKVFENLPVGGLPFFFENWADYETVVDNYLSTGTIETIRELWWDLRPHPDFGTIEVRVCDMPPSISDALAIAALIQALVKCFEEEYLAGVPQERPHPFIVRENKWRAARYGLSGEFINEDGMTTTPVKEAIERLIDTAGVHGEELGSKRYLDRALEILKTNGGAEGQLKAYERLGDFVLLTKDLADGLAKEVEVSGHGVSR